MKWNVNLLGLVGAFVGIAAVFSTWISGALVDRNLIDVINDLDIGDRNDDYLFAGILVILGVVIALLSPLGGILEIAGAGWFALTWESSHGLVIPSIGPYLAIASGVIAIVSMANPIVLGGKQVPVTLKGRLLVFSRPSSTEASGPGDLSKPVWADKFCKHCGRPLAAEATVCPGCGRPVSESPESP